MGVSTMKKVEKFIEDSSVKGLLSKPMEKKLALMFHQEHSLGGGVDSWLFAEGYVAKEHTYSFAYTEVVPLLDMLAAHLCEKKVYGIREKEACQFLRDNTTLNELMIKEIIIIFFHNAEIYGR